MWSKKQMHWLLPVAVVALMAAACGGIQTGGGDGEASRGSLLVANWPDGVGGAPTSSGAEVHYWEAVGAAALKVGGVGNPTVAEPYYLQVLREAALDAQVALAEYRAETYWADVNEQALERAKGTPDPARIREEIVREIEVSGG